MATVAEPSAAFQELVPPLAHEAALVEADRCLECGGPYAEAPCVVACPANVDVPAFVAAVARDEPDVLTSCPLGWGHEPRLAPRLLDAAVDSCFWPLYEVVDGRHRLTYVPEVKAPVEEWLRPQARFAHLFSPEGAALREEIQRRVDAEWGAIVAHCGETP